MYFNGGILFLAEIKSLAIFEIQIVLCLWFSIGTSRGHCPLDCSQTPHSCGILTSLESSRCPRCDCQPSRLSTPVIISSGSSIGAVRELSSARMHMASGRGARLMDGNWPSAGPGDTLSLSGCEQVHTRSVSIDSLASGSRL